jgi:hypothetical protein
MDFDKNFVTRLLRGFILIAVSFIKIMEYSPGSGFTL